MKVVVAKLDPVDVRRTHAIEDCLPGWFFRRTEESNNVWRVDGTDLWGHTVSTTDHDFDRALKFCIKAAEDINAQLAAHP